ncbi:LamG domain-containing protein [Streptomyces sp. C-3]
MQPISLAGFTQSEILSALQGASGTRAMSFRYELLDTRNGVIREIDNVLSGSVEYNFLADIKRTAKFSLVDDGAIDFLSNRIRPWVRLRLPGENRLLQTRPFDSAVTQMSPTFRWKLDELPGAARLLDSGPYRKDLASGGTTATTGAAPLLTADAGRSVSFPGTASSDAFFGSGLSTQLNGLSSFSVCAWVSFPATFSNIRTVVATSEGADWGIGLMIATSQAHIRFQTSTGEVWYFGGYTFVANTTYLLAATWTSGSAPKFYVNGAPVSLGASSSTGNSGLLSKSHVGYVGRGQSGVFPGLVDDASIFNRALTQDEITTLYTAGTAAAVPDRIVEPYMEWPQGVFLLTSPTRKANDTGVVIRDVDAYDQLLIYRDDVVVNRYAVAAGSKYTDAIEQLLGTQVDKNITRSSLTLPTTMEWEPGTPKLSIINALLNAINYESLFFDEYGTAVVRPYVQPADRASEHTYATDQRSVILPDAEQTLDLFDIPNSFTLVVSDPDRPPLTSTYVNSDPGSITSTVSRGRTIVKYMTEQTAPDQTTLDTAARNAAYDASQVYEQISFSTGLMPIHSNADVYTLTYSDLGISAKYAEQSWSMTLEAGATMTHTCRRTVRLDQG